MSKLEVDAIEPQSGTTLTLGASGDAVNIASGASITDFKSTGIDDNATSTAITIDSSENVGIGTSSPNSQLDITNTTGASGLELHRNFSGDVSGATNSGGLDFTLTDTATSNQVVARINAQGEAGTGDAFGGIMRFYTSNTSGSPSERMRIEQDGDILIGQSSTELPGFGNTTTGLSIRPNGQIFMSYTPGAPLYVNTNTDGQLVQFREDGNLEGTISVSGGTVSYNGFTGTHWSRFTDNSKPTILKGTVLESLDEICDWYNLEFDVTTTTQDGDGNDVIDTYKQRVPYILQDGQSVGDVINYNHEGTDYQATIVKEADIKHVKSKVSNTVDAKNVYGVFYSWDDNNEQEGYNDFYVASVGTFVVRIKANETIAKGDLLQSNGDGTAKVQTDDNVKSSSFAKVLSTTVIETYEDGSFLVPCSLMC